MVAITTLVALVSALPKVIAAAPEFVALFNGFLAGFSEDEQDLLKSAYQKARDGSDSAQSDFVDASRGS